MADDRPTESYGDAMRELEGILDDLERDSIDVDELSSKVERAASLIRFCRSRIVETRMTVERIVAELDDAAEPLSPAPDPTDDADGTLDL